MSRVFGTGYVVGRMQDRFGSQLGTAQAGLRAEASKSP
jgi:hypothetical protein